MLLLADALLLLHLLFVAFVVLGLLLVWVGGFYGWSWVTNAWFRSSHLLAIVIVAAQSWMGLICPLTIWEMQLRAMAGDTVYAGTFVSHWLQAILYYQAPGWVFTLTYTLFCILVAASLVWIPPSFRRRGHHR